jgi:hypothetical protein
VVAGCTMPSPGAKCAVSTPPGTTCVREAARPDSADTSSRMNSLRVMMRAARESMRVSPRRAAR